MKQPKFNLKYITGGLLFVCLLSTTFFACKKDNSTENADKTALIAKIAEAQDLIDNTVEGTKPGQYVVGSKAPLQAAIDAGNAVVADDNASQETVTNATAQVQAAIDTYKSNLIEEIAAANLIGYWKMNGNANDSSGSNNNGTLMTGHPFYGAGTPVASTDRFNRAGMAYFFDHGANIEVPYTSSLNPQEMTLSLWCKKDTAGRTINKDTYTMMSLNRWNGYKYQWQSANKLFYTVHAINGTDTVYYDRDDEVVQLDNGVWYHAVVTFKSGEMKFFVNGDLVKTWTDVPGNPITVPSTINFVIGQDLPTSQYLTVDGDFQVAWGGFWTGDLDDAMFYNIALSDAQVKSIYDNQKSL